MNTQEPRHLFTSELARVRWGRRLALALLFAALPLALLLFRVSDALRLPLFLLLIPYAFVCIAAVLYFILIPCPRCRRRFFGGSRRFDPGARKCWNCGLDLHNHRH
jgi:hypothetical protein